MIVDPPPDRTIRQIAVSDDGVLWALCDDASVWTIDPEADRPVWRLVVRPRRGELARANR